MATQPEWDRISFQMKSLERVEYQIRAITIDCQESLRRLVVLLRYVPPCKNSFIVEQEMASIDSSLWVALPRDAGPEQKRQRLRDLYVISRRVSWWEECLEKIPSSQPSLETLRELREMMQADLIQRFVRVSILCRHLDSARRGQVFELTPPMMQLDLCSLTQSFDERNFQQWQRHLMCLKIVQTHLIACEARWDIIAPDP